MNQKTRVPDEEMTRFSHEPFLIKGEAEQRENLKLPGHLGVLVG